MKSNKVSLLGVLVGLAGLSCGVAADWTGHVGIHNNAGPGWGGGHGGWGHGGLNVSGSYSGSKWSLNYNLGSGWGSSNSWGYASGPNSWNLSNGGFRPVGTWDRYGWSDYYRRYGSYGYATGQVISAGNGPTDWSLLPGVMPTSAPGAAPLPPPPPPTKMELAVDALAQKQLPEAKGFFIEHLAAFPDDVEAQRRLAMCLIEGKEIDTGLAMLRDLYVTDPTLADRPYDGAAAGQNLSRLRELVTKITPYAHKVKSPSAWLGVVIAMQAEGRNAPALKMIARAKDAGLERSVVDQFAAALAPPAPATTKKPASGSNPTATPVTPATPATPPVPGPAVQPEAASPTSPAAAPPATVPEKPIEKKADPAK
jgi:hypothetical protein